MEVRYDAALKKKPSRSGRWEQTAAEAHAGSPGSEYGDLHPEHPRAAPRFRLVLFPNSVALRVWM